ncbi:MAG: hypothetical protein WCS18_12115 [Sphaerochaetaceae bacterium]
MAMSVDSILQRLLTIAANLNPDLDLSVGGDTYIRFQATASGIWGLYRQCDWTVNQIFPTSMAQTSLERTASAYGKDVTAMTPAEILTWILARLRNPPAGGKRTDYETWALEASSTGSAIALSASMVTSSDLTGFAAANAVASHSDTEAFSVVSGDEGKSLVIDLGSSTSVFGIGIGTRTSRYCTFRIYSSSDAATWTSRGSLTSTFWWSMATFDAAEARYWKLEVVRIEEIDPALIEDYYRYACCGIELYTDAGSAESATDSAGTADYYGAGTMLMIVEPSTLSMRFLETCRAYMYAAGPVSPRELWVIVPTETEIQLRVTLTGSLSSQASFLTEVQQYFAGLYTGEMWIPAQIFVYAIKYGATNAAIEMSTDSGSTWTTVEDPVSPGTTEKYVLGEVTIQ